MSDVSAADYGGMVVRARRTRSGAFLTVLTIRLRQREESNNSIDVPNFGNYTHLMTNPRVLQFALRYEFYFFKLFRTCSNCWDPMKLIRSDEPSKKNLV